MNIPTHLHYTADHEWVALGDGPATVGITAYAADALGDVVFVDLPAPGTVITVGDVCGEVESTKSVSDLCAPVDGTVVEINPLLADDPSLINSDPFEGGWLFRVEVQGTPDLLSPVAYADLTRRS